MSFLSSSTWYILLLTFYKWNWDSDYEAGGNWGSKGLNLIAQSPLLAWDVIRERNFLPKKGHFHHVQEM